MDAGQPASASAWMKAAKKVNMTNTASKIITLSNKIMANPKITLMTPLHFTNSSDPRCLWSRLNTFKLRRRRFKELNWRPNSESECIRSRVKKWVGDPEARRRRPKLLCP